MKLNGTEPVVSLDLSEKRLCVASAIVIASLIGVNASLTSIGEGGLNLKNSLGDEGWGAIFAGVCSSKESKISSIDASRQRIGPKGAKLIAEALHTSVNASLTSCNVLNNNMDVEAAKSLVEALKDKDVSLCGIQRNQTTANFRSLGLTPADALLLASDLSKAGVSGSLTSVR